MSSAASASPYDVCRYEIIKTDGSKMNVTERGLWTEASCEEIALRKIRTEKISFEKLIITYGAQKKVQVITPKDLEAKK